MAHREALIAETFGARERFKRTVGSEARLPHEVDAEEAISAVMCTLTERLTAGEAHVLLDALPQFVRGFFSRCVAHRDGRPAERLDRADFLDRVAHHLDLTPAHAELVCSAVFGAVRAEVPAKMVDDVAQQLPHGLKELWRGDPICPSFLATETSRDARLILEEQIRLRAPLPSGVSADAAFTAVMCGFSRRLSGGEARDLLLSLPESLRPLIARSVQQRDEAAAVFDGGEFADRIREDLGCTPSEVEPIVRTVFDAVSRLIPAAQRSHVASQLPLELKELWLDEGGTDG
jgi:uncharacterized protein (DUF2267 family)